MALVQPSEELLPQFGGLSQGQAGPSPYGLTEKNPPEVQDSTGPGRRLGSHGDPVLAGRSGFQEPRPVPAEPTPPPARPQVSPNFSAGPAGRPAHQLVTQQWCSVATNERRRGPAERANGGGGRSRGPAGPGPHCAARRPLARPPPAPPPSYRAAVAQTAAAAGAGGGGPPVLGPSPARLPAGDRCALRPSAGTGTSGPRPRRPPTVQPSLRWPPVGKHPGLAPRDPRPPGGDGEELAGCPGRTAQPSVAQPPIHGAAAVTRCPVTWSVAGPMP
ncbi:proline-rich protein HaeIII subfamily 1-like [Mustela lutreola]|uniref:proline-rich protein HaeIII subfamily 1-like n=1 Tax=Mustela lutreola TaxID=9666 RepID=UPI002797AB17|nr:proline-rich protein HaeIII subfamily 1-like [Mustela lutreola]